MSGRPLHQLDPVPVRVGEPRRLRAVGPGRELERPRLEAVSAQPLQRGRQVGHLDRQVVEAAADVDTSVAGTVDQFQRGCWFVGELEPREAPPIVERDPAELLVSQAGVEVERSPQVGDAVGGKSVFMRPRPGGVRGSGGA
jgi:hypothetical protein